MPRDETEFEDDLEDEADDDGDNEEDEDEDEEGGEPFRAFVGMASDRDGCDQTFDVINEVCDDLGVEVLRAHPDQIVGSPSGDKVLHQLVNMADFAIIDFTHERSSVTHEIGLVDMKLERAFILLVAKQGTPLFANIEGRVIRYYDDLKHLRKIMRRQVEAMIEAWQDRDDDEEDDDEDEED